jgi:hypothetical protein
LAVSSATNKTFSNDGPRVQPVDLETVFATSDNSQSNLIKEASANLVLMLQTLL